jgi:hypothetical protein
MAGAVTTTLWSRGTDEVAAVVEDATVCVEDATPVVPGFADRGAGINNRSANKIIMTAASTTIRMLSERVPIYYVLGSSSPR